MGRMQSFRSDSDFIRPVRTNTETADGSKVVGGGSKVIDRGGRGVTAATDRREGDKGTAVDRGEGGTERGGWGLIWGETEKRNQSLMGTPG